MGREFNPDVFTSGQKPQLETLQQDSQRRKIRDLEIQVHTLTQRVDQLMLALEQKSTQHQHAIRNLEGNSKSAIQEIARNQTVMAQKAAERRLLDAKTEELLDRHNQVVQNFELRMNNLQKVTSEQEVKLMAYQATIDEILREIRNARRANSNV